MLISPGSWPDDQPMLKFLLICLFPLILKGADMRVTAVVRQGPPPYVEEDRLYRIEGEGILGVRKGDQLQLRKAQGGQSCGVVTVVQVFDWYLLGKMTQKGNAYPVKGDFAFPLGASQDRKASRPLLPGPKSAKPEPEDQTPEPGPKDVPVTSPTPVTPAPPLVKPATSGAASQAARVEAKPVLPKVRQSHWEFGLGFRSSTLTGTFASQGAAYATAFDTDQDLRLARRGGLPSLRVDYVGPRFLLHLAAGGANFQGQSVLGRDLALDSAVFPAGEGVRSELKLLGLELDWTVKVWRPARGHVGLDLGIDLWNLRSQVDGNGYQQADPSQTLMIVRTETKGSLPLPRLGISAGWNPVDALTLRVHARASAASGARYQDFGADLRYFPAKRFGIFLNAAFRTLDAPQGKFAGLTTFRVRRNDASVGIIYR